MIPLSQLIDLRRELQAQVDGLSIEIAMRLGDRDGARRALREMEAQASARRAVVEAECFDAMGERDAAAMRGGQHGE